MQFFAFSRHFFFTLKNIVEKWLAKQFPSPKPKPLLLKSYMACSTNVLSLFIFFFFHLDRTYIYFRYIFCWEVKIYILQSHLYTTTYDLPEEKNLSINWLRNGRRKTKIQKPISCSSWKEKHISPVLVMQITLPSKHINKIK